MNETERDTVKVAELEDRIKRAIAAAEQPHYGDADTKLDNYYEALCILKGDEA